MVIVEPRADPTCSRCSDIVERFQLSLMLTVIAVRNLIEMSGSDFAFLPKSFIKGKGNVETILSVGPNARTDLYPR